MAHKIFVRSCYETSALKFVAKIFTSEEEFKQMVEEKNEDSLTDTMDESLIQIATPSPSPVGGETSPAPTSGPKNPQSNGQASQVENNNSYLAGFDDGYEYKNVILNEDGILICNVSGVTFKGHMMIVKDPSRVMVGVCANVNQEGKSGDKLSAIINRYGAIAGINAGGFLDINGRGTGSIPLGHVFSEGKLINKGTADDVLVGFDNNNILHVDRMDTQAALDKNIRDAVSFTPRLVVNGNRAKFDTESSGLNPRTCIGQRKDGAVLLLVIDGRQAASLGATLKDCVDVMLDFGAVNACNLDGGTSSLMIYKDEEISSKSNIISERNISTAILIK